MQKKAKVAIVVLNYLNDADTVECVQSIRELEGGPYDVVVVDNGSQGNLAQEKRVADLRSNACAAHHGLPDLKSVRCDDVALLAVGVNQQRDARRTVRVVLDRLYSCSDAVLRTLEVDVTIHLLVTSADVADRHLTGIVSAARALLGAEQRLLRLRRRNLVERADNLMSRTCRDRFKFSYCHLR